MQHTADFRRAVPNLIDLLGGRELQPQRKFELCFALRLRTKSNHDVVSVGVRSMLMALCDMGRNTDRGTAQL